MSPSSRSGHAVPRVKGHAERIEQAHGVDRMFYLEATGPLNNAQKNIVYLASPQTDLMRLIASETGVLWVSVPTPQRHQLAALSLIISQ